MPHKPSYKDIAGRAGVSQMTVSLAMRGHPSIPAATREKVLSAAREVGYSHDPEVARLMNYIKDRGRKQPRATVAVLNFWPDKHHLNRSIYTRALMAGIRERAGELGFQPDVFWVSEPGMTQRRIFDILVARGIRSIILPTAPTSSCKIDADLSGFTVVAASRVWEPMKLDCILPNHSAEIRLALENITASGCRRIGLAIDEVADLRSDKQWLSAYLHYWFRSPAKDRVAPLAAKTITPAKLERWLAKERPEVVLSPLNSLCAMLEKLGLRVPGDCAFVTLNWTESVRGMAGVSLNPRQVGAVAVDILSAKSAVNQCGIPKNRICVQVEPFWVCGSTFPQETCGPAGQAPDTPTPPYNFFKV